MPENKITDLSYLISICDNDPSFKVEMINTFLKNIPEILSEMESALSNKEWKKSGDLAHKLKPSFTFMGIDSAKDLILYIEKNGRLREHTEGISNSYNELKSIFKMASVELNNELTNLD